jgi:hypothetical protein
MADEGSTTTDDGSTAAGARSRQDVSCASAPGSAPHQEGVRLVPRSGEVIRVTRAASVQFASPMLFRVIRVHDWSTYDGWAWLDGYELNTSGDAIDRRSIFVQVGGLQRAQVTIPTRVSTSRSSAPVSPQRRAAQIPAPAGMAGRRVVAGASK